MIIYKITNKINGKVYIGQTTRSIEIRWKDHIAAYKTSSNYLHKSMLKYGVNNFEIKPLIKCNTYDELQNREVLAIRLYNSMIPHGMNMTNGGNQNRITPEIRLKISNTNALKAANSIPYWKGRNLSDETKAKISKTKKDKRMAVGRNNSMYGKKHTVSSVNKNAISNGSKEFDVFLLVGNSYVGTWLVKTQCARDLKITREQVRDCLKGRAKSAGGYVFKYK